MRIALIPPYCLLGKTSQTNYQLMLPQLIDNIKYINVYQSLCRNDKQFVILDNGAAEGKEITPRQLLDIATRFKPNEVVIPDTIADPEDTVRKAFKFAEFAVPDRHFAPLPFRLMFVTQGKTVMQAIDVAMWASEQSWIDTIGIPRHLLTTTGDMFARIEIANTIQARGSTKQIHFLGANSVWPTEVRALADHQITNQDYVRGMDSSLPFNYAWHGKHLDTGSRCNRPENYFQIQIERFGNELVQENIDAFLYMGKCDPLPLQDFDLRGAVGE